MEVILREEVQHLGQRGDVVDVADGYDAISVGGATGASAAVDESATARFRARLLAIPLERNPFGIYSRIDGFGSALAFFLLFHH
jgi:hypothetical protein